MAVTSNGSSIPNSTILIIILAYAILGTSLTSLRLFLRGRRKWGWDDFFVTLASLFLILQCCVLWMRIKAVPALVHNHTASLAFFYLNSICFYAEDWFSRISILLSVHRIVRSRRLIALCGLFFLLFVGNCILLVSECQNDNSGWKNKMPPRCVLKESIPIYRMSTGIAADTALIAIPLRALTVLKSAPVLKNRLRIIFCCTIFMTAACITQSIVTIKIPGIPELVASMTEGLVAIITASLTILVTAAFRLSGFGVGFASHVSWSKSQVRAHYSPRKPFFLFRRNKETETTDDSNPPSSVQFGTAPGNEPGTGFRLALGRKATPAVNAKAKARAKANGGYETDSALVRGGLTVQGDTDASLPDSSILDIKRALRSSTDNVDINNNHAEPTSTFDETGTVWRRFRARWHDLDVDDIGPIYDQESRHEVEHEKA